jgi:cytochrome P450
VSDDETQQRPRTPPSIAGHFLFGNAPEYYEGRLRFLERMAKEHGNLVRYRIGCDWYHLINVPSEARDVLRDWDYIDNATSDGGFQLDHSFIAKNGKARVLPRSISHSAICPRALAKTHELMVDAVGRMLEDWEDGQDRDVLLDMMRMNLEVVSVTLFGQTAAAWMTPVLPVLTDLERLIGAYTSSQEKREKMHIKKRRQMFILIEALVEKLLADHPDGAGVPALEIMRRAQAAGKLTEREVIHELCVLLLSISSTAVVATWTWYCLSRNPEARSRLEAELDTLPPGPVAHEDLGRLTYLDAVLKEVMRVRPPIGVLHRKIETTWERDALQLPAGESIIVSPYLLHRHPEFWREPEQFRPERFDAGSEWHHPEQELAYIPFGLGVRHCIGETMAWQQLKITLATIARRFRLEVPPDHEATFDVSPLGSLHPEALHMPVHVHARRPVLAHAPQASSTEARAPQGA